MQVDLDVARQLANDVRAVYHGDSQLTGRPLLNTADTLTALCDEVERLQQALADARMDLHDRATELERCQSGESER